MRRACRRSMASENSTCMDRIFLKSVLDTHSSVDRKSTPSELQSHSDLVCRLLLEKKKNTEYNVSHVERCDDVNREIRNHTSKFQFNCVAYNLDAQIAIDHCNYYQSLTSFYTCAI